MHEAVFTLSPKAASSRGAYLGNRLMIVSLHYPVLSGQRQANFRHYRKGSATCQSRHL